MQIHWGGVQDSANIEHGVTLLLVNVWKCSTIRVHGRKGKGYQERGETLHEVRARVLRKRTWSINCKTTRKGYPIASSTSRPQCPGNVSSRWRTPPFSEENPTRELQSKLRTLDTSGLRVSRVWFHGIIPRENHEKHRVEKWYRRVGETVDERDRFGATVLSKFYFKAVRLDSSYHLRNDRGWKFKKFRSNIISRLFERNLLPRYCNSSIELFHSV